MLVLGILPLFGLLAMQWLVDAVASGLAGKVDSAAAFDDAAFAIAVAAAVALSGNLLRAVQAVLTETHGRRLADACAGRLQEHTATLDLVQFDRPAFHDLLHRAGAEAATRPVRFVQDAAALGTATVSLLAMSGVLARVAIWLPFVVAAAAIPTAWARRRHARLRYRWQEEATVDQREVGYLAGVLTARSTAKEVRALGLLPAMRERLRAVRAGLRTSLHRLALQRARDDVLVHTVAGVALFGAYLYLGHVALAGGLTIGGLVLHAQAVQRAQNGVRDLLGALGGVAEDRLFLRPCVDFLALRPAIAPVAPAVVLPRGTVRFAAENVGFRYPDSPRDALAGITFAVERGERLAIVGPNGSGKSTLVKLLCRLYDPTTGALRVDRVDLRQTDPESWRRRVAVLFQDANSFELTLGENLRLGHHALAVDEAALWQALAAVGLEQRVRELPGGLATPLSRRLRGGVDWSGGEQRRLLLARALAQPSDVLLLDEPWALLDGVVAETLAAQLTAAARQRTVVVVDHRPAAVRWADRVLLLDQGRLIAQGRPDELAAREPLFRSLFPDG